MLALGGEWAESRRCVVDGSGGWWMVAVNGGRGMARGMARWMVCDGRLRRDGEVDDGGWMARWKVENRWWIGSEVWRDGILQTT